MANKRLYAPVPSAHRLIWFIYYQLIAEKMTLTELSGKSGVMLTTLRYWWRGQRSPTLKSLEAVLGVFEYILKPTPAPAVVEKPRLPRKDRGVAHVPKIKLRPRLPA